MTLKEKAEALAKADMAVNGGHCNNAPYRIVEDGERYVVRVKAREEDGVTIRRLFIEREIRHMGFVDV